MEATNLLKLVESLDRRSRIRLYLALAHQLTVRGREAYFYPADSAKAASKGFNELQHSLLGYVRALESDSPRCSDEEFPGRLFGFARKLGVEMHLRLALDAITPGPSPDVLDNDSASRQQTES